MNLRNLFELKNLLDSVPCLDYKLFIRGLSGDEYFFILDLQLLLHRRCLDCLYKVFNN